MKKAMFLIPLISCIVLLSIVIYDKTIQVKILNLDMTPISIYPINNTQITSLVLNTEDYGNNSKVNLSNGLNFITNRTILKSGDSVLMNIKVMKPSCQVMLTSDSMSKLENNSLIRIQIHSQPKCLDDYRLVQIESWTKINQK